MDAKFKAEWVKALRGGEYRQGKAWLRKNDTYCCLGVACDIRGAKWETDGLGIFLLPDYEGEDAILPSEIGDDIGVNRSIARRLAEMNDSGESFVAIADWIERNL